MIQQASRSTLALRWYATTGRRQESIYELVPRTGMVDIVTPDGFKKNQNLERTMRQLKRNGSKLIVVNVTQTEEGRDPKVICKIVEEKSKPQKKKREVEAGATADSKMSENENENENGNETEGQGEDSETVSKGKARKEARLKKQQELIERQSAKALSKNSSKVKSIVVSWNIGPNDFLSQKKSTIQNWLQAYHPVQIFLGKANLRRLPQISALDLEKRDILRKICVDVCEEAGAIKKSTDKIEKGLDQEVIYYYIPKN